MSLLGVWLFIEETHEFFVLGFLYAFGFYCQRFAALLEKLEYIGVISNQCFQSAVGEMGVKDRISLSVGQRLHPEERHSRKSDLHLLCLISKVLYLNSFGNLASDHHKHLRLSLLDAAVQVIEVEIT